MKEFLMAGALVCAGACAALADAPSWPSDFDSNLAAHIAEVQPSGDAVWDDDLSAFDSFAFAFLASPSFGTETSPFDSFWLRLASTEGVLINGREPRGMAIIVR